MKPKAKVNIKTNSNSIKYSPNNYDLILTCDDLGNIYIINSLNSEL